MNAVLPEEIRPIHARAVPVYQGGVTVTRHAVGDDGVVWAFPVAGDPNADEHDYTPVAQRLHHRIELPCREYAVVAHVDDHRFAQPSRGAALLQNPDHILRLPPHDSVYLPPPCFPPPMTASFPAPPRAAANSAAAPTMTESPSAVTVTPPSGT